MRSVLFTAMLVLTACSPAPVSRTSSDPTRDPGYLQNLRELTLIREQAEAALGQGDRDRAAGLIMKGQPLVKTVLSVPQPALEAMEAASALDDLYGRMLLTNGHYGPARLLFQKNVARWRNWRPRTAKTEQRRKAAEANIAECDRLLLK